MSLLNEMLHDLAKQKHTKHAMPLFMPALPQRRGRSNKIILLFCLFVIAFVFYCFLFNKHVEKMSVKTAKSTSKTEGIILNTEINSEPIVQQTPEAVVILPEPVNLISYIEPVTSSISQRAAIQLPGVEDKLNNWVDNQGEPSSIGVNKVYTPQTIEEWHDAQLNKALQAIDKGFDEEAITLLQEILVKVPNASDVRENLASLYLTYGSFAQATEVVNEGLRYAPADAALITIKARIFLDQGKARDAISLLSKYRPPMMSYPDFYGTLAAALQSVGRVRESGSLYQSLIQVDPNDGRYWLGYAIALEHNNKANQAIEAYIRASQNPDSDPTVRDYAENRLKVLQG
ncbi:Anaphase-promoting complex, cyclosome, subunit 3 [Legionella santicrucis]|uniref:Anaphase-promoting complex, cyclosome, subunit 3 n=1 Tax=Legionella santicrucis TaxID=45074 RepID=A0A0W0Y9M6_9GAMM|nr:tetratricopeptide repeat protein [Legionella santicrucis]KTD53644.1 Anaphase-promoting complex, cyclosome, subunit 3 [Legionella santicrucis]